MSGDHAAGSPVRTRLALTGTYNSYNKGDAAMELGALHGIAQALPGGEATILSPFPDLDASFYAPVPVQRCNRRQLVRATVGLVRALAWRMLRPLGLAGDWLLDAPSRLTRDADFVVDLSGDMLTEDYGVHVAYSHYVPLLRALLIGRPYAVLAQSIGPFRYTRALARLLLKRAAAITTRDEISRDYLVELGIPAARVEWTADFAFLMPPAQSDRALQILREAGVADDGRPLLGVSVSRLIDEHYRRRNPAARHVEFLEVMREVVVCAVQEHGANVVLVPHVTGPTREKDDRVISAELRQRLGGVVEAHVLTGDHRPEELKAVIARCTVFLGARMHANIAALSSCVPTVALSYSHKTPGIMAACGMDEFVAPIEAVSAATLSGLVARIFTRREEVAAGLRERIPSMSARALRNVELLRSLSPVPERRP